MTEPICRKIWSRPPATPDAEGGRAWMTLTWIARKAKNIPLDPMKNEGNRNAQ
jgi:hypothetical protein